MAIPTIPVYTGGVANPDGSQDQQEFTNNMFNQLSYEAALAPSLNDTVNEMNTVAGQVDINAAIAQNSADAAQSAANFEGEFAVGVTSAEKGKSYSYNGEVWLCLQNTTTTPSQGTAEWKLSVGEQYITEAQEDLLPTGSSLFKGDDGDYLKDGDTVPAGTTHLRVLIGGEPTVVAMSPVASGVVSLLTDAGATIGATNVEFILINEPERIYFHEGKFSIGRSSNGFFFTIVNEETGSIIARFANDTNPADAHLFNLPLEVRADGHFMIGSAKTLGGSVDLLMRTSGLSDFMYLVGQSEYQNERFVISPDTLPARADGTKKDGSLGAQDTYSFDDALLIPSNRPASKYDLDSYIKFPAWYAIFEQGVGVRRRGGSGLRSYLWNWSGTSESIIECIDNGNVLQRFSDDRSTVGGISGVTEGFDNTVPMVSDRTQHANFAEFVLETLGGSSYERVLVAQGVSKIVDVNATIVISGASSSWYWCSKVMITADGSLNVINAPSTNVPAQITPELYIDSNSNLSFKIAYSGGIGGSIRTNIKYEIS